VAIKVKRKQTVREEAKQDQIYETGSKMFEYLEEHKLGFAIGVVSIFVAVLLGSMLLGSRSDDTRAVGASVLGAARLLSAPIGDDPNEDDSLPAFDSEEARSGAVLEALSEVLYTDNPGAAAELLAGTVSATMGDAGQAQQRFRSASSSSDSPLLTAISLQALAATQADAGDYQAAIGTLAEAREVVPAMGLFADLELARWAEASGDYGDALARYTDLVTRTGDIAAVLAGTADRGISEIAEHRAAVIELLVGAPAPAPEEDDPGVEDAPEEDAPEEDAPGVEDAPEEDAPEEDDPEEDDPGLED
jgi:tetratricopeptide (TPR) repeat protein